MSKIFFTALLLLLLSCQKKPAISPAADSMSSLEAPPMGASTFNSELKKELAILDDLINNRVEKRKLEQLKKALMEGSISTLTLAPQSYDAKLIKLLITMPELIHKKDLIDNKKWLKAKLYFLRRRFIESAMLITEVLKEKPGFIEARNLRARSIFFLGNPNLAIKELQSIIEQEQAKSINSLDAMYLIGAIAYESSDFKKEHIKTGISAWKNYLELAQDSQLKKEVMAGIKELNDRLLGRKINFVKDLFLPQEEYDQEKNAILTAFNKEENLLALRLADEYLVKHKDNDIYTIKARILFKNGKLDEAQTLLITVADKNYAPAHHYLGMTFMLQGKPGKAIESWQETIAIDPGYANRHNLNKRINVAKSMIAPQKIDTH